MLPRWAYTRPELIRAQALQATAQGLRAQWVAYYQGRKGERLSGDLQVGEWLEQQVG